MANVNVPDHLRAFGDEARRLRDVVDRGLEHAPSPVLADSPCDFFAERFARQAWAWGQLESVFNGPLNAFGVANDGESVGAHRLAGRLEQILRALLDEYQLLRGLKNTQPFDRRDLELMIGGLRHALDEIRGWLQELIEVMADPAKELNGPRAVIRDGRMDIALPLTLDAAPQFEELERRIDRKTVALRRRNVRNGFVTIVCVIIILMAIF